MDQDTTTREQGGGVEVIVNSVDSVGVGRATNDTSHPSELVGQTAVLEEPVTVTTSLGGQNKEARSELSLSSSNNSKGLLLKEDVEAKRKKKINMGSKDDDGKHNNSCVIDVKCSSGGDGGDGENSDNGEMVCRICHLTSSDQASETLPTTTTTTTTSVTAANSTGETQLIQLGCGCKDELGFAHSHCAEAWFKLKGNRMCEICGRTAKNVTGVGDNRFMEEWNESRLTESGINLAESSRRCWQGQPFCNFLMACLVIAFVLPWFFRVNMF